MGDNSKAVFCFVLFVFVVAIVISSDMAKFRDVINHIPRYV